MGPSIFTAFREQLKLKPESQKGPFEIFESNVLKGLQCIFGDGTPITLKFANAIGEILTAGPIKDVPPLPFGHYI